MSEHMPRNPERAVETLPTIERSPERRSVERVGESREAVEKNVERAKNQAQKEALTAREIKGKEETNSDQPTPIITTEVRNESFNRTMRQIQSEMPAGARAFSKIIHNPVVERTSDVVGATLARPHAILSGSLFACLAVLGLYLMARYYGFALAGSETIVAFLIGWVCGIIFDFLRVLITGKRQ